MPYWGWVLLIAGLSALAVASIFAIVRTTHRLPKREPTHGDHRDIAAPVPMDVAAADSLTARELEEERSHNGAQRTVSSDR
jgi:hypothetical protein